MVKRFFILFEILLAITLVALIAIPLTFSSVRFLMHQQEQLELMECERIADLSFVDIKENLYRQSPSWKELTSSENRRDLPPTFLKLKGFKEKRVDRYFEYILQDHDTIGNETFGHLEIILHLIFRHGKSVDDRIYDYHLLIRKIQE